jgi:hypothetical protein
MGIHDGLSKIGTGPGRNFKDKYKGTLIFDPSKRKKPVHTYIGDTVYITGWYVIHDGKEVPLYYQDAEYVETHKCMNGDYAFNGIEVEYTIDNWCEMGLQKGQEQYSGTYQMGYGTVARLIHKEVVEEELERCIKSPYYFATNYLIVNGEKFSTRLSEEEFNTKFNQILNQLK